MGHDFCFCLTVGNVTSYCHYETATLKNKLVLCNKISPMVYVRYFSSKKKEKTTFPSLGSLKFFAGTAQSEVTPLKQSKTFLRTVHPLLCVPLRFFAMKKLRLRGRSVNRHAMLYGLCGVQLTASFEICSSITKR